MRRSRISLVTASRISRPALARSRPTWSRPTSCRSLSRSRSCVRIVASTTTSFAASVRMSSTERPPTPRNRSRSSSHNTLGRFSTAARTPAAGSPPGTTHLCPGRQILIASNASRDFPAVESPTTSTNPPARNAATTSGNRSRTTNGGTWSPSTLAARCTRRPIGSVSRSTRVTWTPDGVDRAARWARPRSDTSPAATPPTATAIATKMPGNSCPTTDNTAVATAATVSNHHPRNRRHHRRRIRTDAS